MLHSVQHNLFRAARAIWPRLPRRLRRQVLYTVADFFAQNPAKESSAPKSLNGLRHLIVGPFTSPYSLGHVARLLQAAVKGHVDVGIKDINYLFPQGIDAAALPDIPDTSFENDQPTQIIYAVSGNLIPLSMLTLPRSLTHRSFATGHLVYEYEGVPPSWVPGLRRLHRVIVPSQFVADAIHARFPDMPIEVVPYPIGSFTPPPVDLHSLETDPLVVLHSCNASSGVMRKNPIAVARAFSLAFEPDSGPRLRMHINNAASAPHLISELRELFRHRSDLDLSVGTMSREKYWEWWQGGHLFCSLHRSEGFGLGLSEAMAAGYGAMATDWSGNREFMNSRNAWMINYDMVRVNDPLAPAEERRFSWAEPNLDDAISTLRSIQEDRTDLLRLARSNPENLARTMAPDLTRRALIRREDPQNS